MKVTRAEIEAAKKHGGWTRDVLARWGVPWPPPRGWRRELEDDPRRAPHCEVCGLYHTGTHQR